MAYRPISAIVLAAGEGTRMKSSTAKVLHKLCGRPMLLHVLDALVELPLERIVIVVGHDSAPVIDTVKKQFSSKIPIEFVKQEVQRGTGDAVSVGLSTFSDAADTDGDVLVLAGDVPLLCPETLAVLATEHRLADAAATLLTVEIPDPTGYGRVVRDKRGEVVAIVEQADANAVQLELTEINTSIYCFRQSYLAPALRRVIPDNAQEECYLTDTISVLRATGHSVLTVAVPDTSEVVGVNDRAQLATAESLLRARINNYWMRSGVTMVDPARTYIDTSVVLDPDVTLLPGVSLEGSTQIGASAIIGPDCRLIDTVVGARSVICQTVARDAEVGADVTIGPWALLRSGTKIGAGAHIGTFVETKNSDIGEGAKVPHLAYLGDTDIGPGANVGAGTITANYDGREKHRTQIGRDAKLGSNTVLVAPVTVGDGAYTAAGAVVVDDVPPGALAKGVPAQNYKDWVKKNRSDDDIKESR